VKAIRHEFLCEREHNWNKLAAADASVDPGRCPVCDAPVRLHASLQIVDRPLFRIESSATIDPLSGKVMGDGLYYLVLQSPDLSEEISSRFPLKWDHAAGLARDLRELTYDKAKRIFLAKADEVAGIHPNLRAKPITAPSR
jgi:hypothetical protein